MQMIVFSSFVRAYLYIFKLVIDAQKELDAIQKLKWVFKMSFLQIMITGTCLSEVLQQRIHWTTKEVMPSVGSLTKF